MLSLWLSTGESPLAEVVAQIRRLVVCRSGNWVWDLVLCLTLWPNLVRGRAALAHRGDLAHCTEMAALTASRSSFLPQRSADPRTAR